MRNLYVRVSPEAFNMGLHRRWGQAGCVMLSVLACTISKITWVHKWPRITPEFVRQSDCMVVIDAIHVSFLLLTLELPLLISRVYRGVGIPGEINGSIRFSGASQSGGWLFPFIEDAIVYLWIAVVLCLRNYLRGRSHLGLVGVTLFLLVLTL